MKLTSPLFSSLRWHCGLPGVASLHSPSLRCTSAAVSRRCDPCTPAPSDARLGADANIPSDVRRDFGDSAAPVPGRLFAALSGPVRITWTSRSRRAASDVFSLLACSSYLQSAYGLLLVHSAFA